MYCPKCGTLLSDDQKFCRACGLGLQEIAATVRRETQLATPRQPGPVDAPSPETKPDLQRRAIITVLTSLVVGCLLPIAAGLSDSYPWIKPFIPVIAGIAGIILFAGAMMIIYATSGESIESKSGSNGVAELPPADTTNQLEAPPNQFAAAPAVTEGTTELFESKNQT
jgi:hypothetical protein